MNNAGRKELAKITAMIDSIDLSGMEADLNEIAGGLEGIAEEEQEKFDNLTEGLQQSDMGQRLEAAAGALSEAASALESALNALQEIQEALDEARDHIDTAQE